TGLLAAAPIVAPALTGGAKRHTQNAFVIALDVAKLRPLEDFRADVAALAAAVKARPPQPPDPPLWAAGARRAGAAALHPRGGIALAPKTLAMLRQAASERGLSTGA